MQQMVLLGDEAVAMGAVHSGITAAYAYPGTPSTEITEYLIQYSKKHGKPKAFWCANEKTSYEEALGVSLAGRRSLVSMKHVGLNVAADPFMNSALVNINGGLVVAVADDPGMHSSQNEQDSRYYCEFAKIVCFEPKNQQQAYEMTREAFDISEKYKIPVMVRLVTRLAHSRCVVALGEQRGEPSIKKVDDVRSWVLLPGNARRQFKKLLDIQGDLLQFSEQSVHNQLTLNENHKDYGIITTGIGANYYLENAHAKLNSPSHLHIGCYPIPVKKIRELASHVNKLVIFEEGYPYVEKTIRGIIPPSITIEGKLSGHLPLDGELNPDIVESTLGLEPSPSISVPDFNISNRPPQLCKGCPHIDTYTALTTALSSFDRKIVSSDIGCYTLGALPPFSAIETCVCMGASVSIAKGAADAGVHPVAAVIGDSTFLHSGITPLIDAVSENTNMTLVIVDNHAVAMTGGQPTIMPSDNIKRLIVGLGVDEKHLHVINPLPKHKEENISVFKKELNYQGLSVIIAIRECIETLKKKRKKG